MKQGGGNQAGPDVRYTREVRDSDMLTPEKLELAGNHVVLNWS